MNTLIEQIMSAHGLPTNRPLVVGLAGSVAAGKSTFAAQLASNWCASGRKVEIISTDGFLYPNCILEQRGLLLRKGFPESYDNATFSAFMEDVHCGKPTSVPSYSHQSYDILTAGQRHISSSDVVIVEGVIALQKAFTSGRLDVALYLDADDDDLFRWYYERGERLRHEARGDASSYFVRFLTLSDAQWDAQLKAFWFEINYPNLRLHISPSRAHAQYILHKNSDHIIKIVHSPNTTKIPYGVLPCS